MRSWAVLVSSYSDHLSKLPFVSHLTSVFLPISVWGPPHGTSVLACISKDASNLHRRNLSPPKSALTNKISTQQDAQRSPPLDRAEYMHTVFHDLRPHLFTPPTDSYLTSLTPSPTDSQTTFLPSPPHHLLTRETRHPHDTLHNHQSLHAHTFSMRANGSMRYVR